MSKRKLEESNLIEMSNNDTIPEPIISTSSTVQEKRRRRVCDVIDSIGDREIITNHPGFSTPRRNKPTELDILISPDQGYVATPESADIFVPDWMLKRSDVIDASPQEANFILSEELNERSTSGGIVAVMPVMIDAECYNTNHKNRGKCLVFNHEMFDTGFEKREGSSVDAKRIQKTFTNLGFEVDVFDNYKHSEVIDRVEKLSQENHSDNDCLCIFILTHGLNNDLILAKDVAYKSDSIWKPFTADNCPTLAGKPKLFFFQACRGDKLDAGVTLKPRTLSATETDGGVASYKIPTHADFLIAHSSADGFYSWRNPAEGTWYVQSLCDVLDTYSSTTDLLKMLTITARKVATEYRSYNDLNPAGDDQRQVPSLTSMLIRDLYLMPK
ncbi:caspase-1 isoform X2 [Cephus cinctus]|uniref:Caspase-1 isoform X2 n=1 Tax=Cephus cinctus TaxID=211228 RepID=A0AAJ7BNP1_CEPCN|nr:caspase-1 isoform X2 [Cephus cinctus]